MQNFHQEMILVIILRKKNLKIIFLFETGVWVFASPRVWPERARTEGRGLHKGLRLAHADGKGQSCSRAEEENDEFAAVRFEYGSLEDEKYSTFVKLKKNIFLFSV